MKSTKNKSLPIKKKHWTSNAIIIVLIFIGAIGALIVLIPVVGIGVISGTCSVKNTHLKRQNAVISSRIDNFTATHHDIRGSSTMSGDCLTGSGTTFYLSTSKEYPSYKQAESELLNALTQLGLPGPSSKTIFDDKVTIRDESGASILDTGINNIGYNLQLNQYDDYRFSYSLASTIDCYQSGNDPLAVFCDKHIPVEEVSTAHYMASKPIKSAYVTGHIRYDLYRINK